MIAATEAMRAQLLARRRAPAAPPWRPPKLDDFMPDLEVLAFDATLSHCGWAQIEVRDRVHVQDKGTINPETSRTGYLETWDKADQLQGELSEIFMYRPGIQAVVEAPLAAGRGSRPESSLIAGMLVWMRDPERTAVISATHVSAVLLGDARIRSADRKKAIREAVIRLVPGAAGRDWNEHQRDAVATGLTHLHDMRAGYRQRGAPS